MNPQPFPAHPSPIVPSKNALRALRRLALSPPVLVVSTIGSVCGIATLNYEVNRRVHIAEQALESKRIIHTLSHGRGAAQLNSMIEAAERGDDFTLSTRGPKKRRKKNPPLRSFSAVALQDPIERINDVATDEPPLQLESQHTTFFRKVTARAEPRLPHRSPLATATKGMHRMAIEKILHASKTHRKSPDSRTSGRPNTRRQSEPHRAQTLLQTRFTPFVGPPNEQPSKLASLHLATGASDSTPDVSLKDYTPEEKIHEYVNVPVAQQDSLCASQTDGVRIHSATATGVSPPEAPIPQGDIQMTNAPEWAISGKIEADVEAPPVLAHSDEEDPSLAWPNRSETRLPGQRIASLLPYLDRDEPMDQHLRQRIDEMKPSVGAKTSIETLLAPAPKEFVDHAKNLLNLETISCLCRFLFAHTSRRRWLAVMRHLTNQHSTMNWTIAEAILYIYRASGCDPKDLNIRPVFELIHHLLATVPNSNRIKQVLFPTSARDTSNAVEVFDLSIKYLQFYCDGQHNTSDCLMELRKIIDAAIPCGLSPPKDLVIPVLRAFVRAKHFETAEDVLEGLEREVGPTDFLSLLQEYTFLNACDGNWEVVEYMLDRFHTMNRSRGRPIDYARLFERLLSQHVAKNRSQLSFNFTIHTMKNAGLIPTNHVSRTLICACIRDGRYDLVVEWLHLIREAFPRVSPGFDLVQGGWLLTDALSDMGASCEEVSRMCQTIAHGYRKDPFGPTFREFAVELVKEDLRHRLCSASAHLPATNVSTEHIRSMTMEQLLKYAYEFRATSTAGESNATYVEGLKNDLAVQISAIVDLAKAFRGESKTLFFGIKNQQDTLLAGRRRDVQDGHLLPGEVLRREFPEVYRHARSPGIRGLTTALVEHYDQRENDGLPVDHSVLKDFITSVGHRYPAEVLDLVEEIYASEFVHGPGGAMFDIDLFKRWLYLVSTDGSVTSADNALTAVIESADRLQWTAHFRTLCEFVTQLGDIDHNALWDEKRFSQKPKGGQLKVFYPEIRRIWLEQNAGRWETFRFPTWKGWEMDER